VKAAGVMVVHMLVGISSMHIVDAAALSLVLTVHLSEGSCCDGGLLLVGSSSMHMLDAAALSLP
jgi:hypothetical protein